MSVKHLPKGSPFPPLTPGMMRMYNMQFCPFAQRTKLVLEYKEIPHEVVNVNLKYKPDWFRARNPLGLVPTLELGDIVVNESNVCNEFLDELYPNRKLIPSDIVRRARDRMLIETFGQVTGLFYEIPKSVAEGTQERPVKKWRRHMKRYENELQQRGEYFGGGSPCMVDFALWPWFERLGVITVIAPETDVTSEEYPHLSTWIARMMELPAVKKTYINPRGHINFFKTLREGNPDYDYVAA
uniref:Glutathione S-transferase omega n=1 Tax=Pinctada fucata TaxID=50426 RepID=D3K379_PINFU|nr:glutathione S-transferase [Pinctada fucata]